MLAEKHNLRTTLLEEQLGEGQPPPKSSRKTPRQRFNQFKDFFGTQVQHRIVEELVQREVYIEPTKWNKIKLFLANFYETFLIILGLALSVYQDDASSFVFQILMQIVLSYNKKQMGAHVLIQKKICIVTFFFSFAIAIFKYIYMKQLEPTLTQTYPELESQLQLLGYNFKDLADGTITFDYWPSLEFETFSMIICFLLIRYYDGQIAHQRKVLNKEEPYYYIHHSSFLSMHRFIYIMFFLTLAVDTFFSQTLTQMIVLALMLLITFLSAIKYSKNVAMTKILVKTCIYLLTIQLAFMAFCQIGPVLSYFKTQQSVYKFLFISGLILNEHPVSMAVTHIFMICFVLGFGSLYFNTYVNYQDFKEHEREFAKPEIFEAVERKKSFDNKKMRDTKTKIETIDDEAALKKSTQRRSMGLLLLSNKITNFNYEKFVVTYKPYVCLWAIRVLSMIFSYAYHGYPALLILTWVLLSFIAPNLSFVSCTTYVYLPIFTAGFFYTYFINIPGLFLTYENDEQQFLYPEIFNSFGRPFRFPPIEVGGMVLNIIFLLLLMGSKSDLSHKRDEFRRALFDKITDRKKIFLYQLFFYILKRVHVFILFFIFLFGMRELNIYYIGLMYFFVVYTASLATFRNSGLVLVVYTASFIWLQYFWSLIEVNVQKGSFTYKLFMMLTLQKTTNDEQFQNFLEYSMPVWQWVILMLQVVMTTVNKFFLPEETWEKSLENPLVKKKYNSLGEYYEEKCDLVLRKKFPATGRFIIKLRMIFSEMIIILILITQGFILVTQPSNLLFWGFLIFSLTLQTAVVSATEEDPKMLRGCASQSKILRLYSGWVLILQIAYHFINDKSFLAQYGFDEILQYLLGDLNEYMTIIGFENYQNSTRSIFAIFISQILFYITATYLEDYFLAQLKRIEEQERDRFEMQQINASQGINMGLPVVAAPDNEHNLAQNNNNNNNNNSVHYEASYVQSTYRQSEVNGAGQSLFQRPQEEEVFITKQEKIHFDYENIRFSIPYMVYQRINQWRILDTLAMNFHIVTATVTIILCTNWQISLFMSFYLLCNVILCIRAASELHKNGQMMGLQTNEMDVDTAHQKNKGYMYNASQILLKIRTQQWTYQYWLLILSMIIMYPTPILTQLQDKMTPYQQSMTNNAIFWLFWSGIYVSPGEVQNYGNHAALYVMLILLIFEKQSQRWQLNRYGCTLSKVREFKHLEEKIQLIKEDATDFQPRNATSPIPESQPQSEFITILEAKQECERIESLYRVQTNEIKEKRLRQKIELGLKRKYTIKLRNGMKIVMEQISLQLLLFSCANKSNLVSVIYLGLLLTFLLIKNKTTGMLYMSYVFGFTLAVEYMLTLTNLTSLNSPMRFPKPYQEGYPSQEFPTGQFIFPWFLKVDYLRDNLNWAHFFSIDVVGAQVNDIWFDFANLVILTIYFFNYGNQINANSIKVSFSQTKSLEDALDEYSRMQIMKKYYMKTKKGKNQDEEFNKAVVEESDEDEDKDGLKKSDSYEDENMSEKAADDSLEYFLGATHYLNEIKANLFIYYFTKKSRYFAFIGLQIVTLVMTFLLAMLCRSLMSLGYMIACVPLILQITDFFNLDKLQQEGRRWNHPYYICGPLMIYSFIDISLQIFCQAPFYTSSEFERSFGFDKVYNIRENADFISLLYPTEETKNDRFLTLANGGENLFFLILKSVNLFFIFLQSRIYQSDSFWQFIRQDLRRLLKLAMNYKRMAMTYRYNNWKLQKIVTVQQRKQKMYEGVAELRMKMNYYLNIQKNLLNQQPAAGRIGSTLRQPLLDKIDEEDHRELPETTGSPQFQEEPSPSLNQEGTPRQSIKNYLKNSSSTNVKSQRRVTISKSLETQFKFSQFQDLLKQDDKYFEKKEAFKKMKSKIGRCGKWYLVLKNKKVNQIAFINDIGEAAAVKDQMAQGKRKIQCDLERVMLNDIDIYYHTKENNSLQKKVRRKMGVKLEEDEIQLKDMKQTLNFLRFSNISLGVIGALLQASFSQMATIAYIFMIVSQVHNAGLISILLPFAVFGYALMEEGRPGQFFWRFIKIYVLVILFLKFIINLDFINNEAFMDNFTAVSNWVLFGLWRTEGIWNFLIYISPEIIILAAVMAQNYYETIIGLYDKREIDLENIEEARERFLLQFDQGQQEAANISVKTDRQRKILEEKDNEVDNDNDEQLEKDKIHDKKILKFGKDIRKIVGQYQTSKKTNDDMFHDLVSVQKQRKELNEDIQQNEEIDRRYSLVLDKHERKKLVKQLKAKRPENKGMLKNFFGKNKYFKRLFPKVKEAKPGIDFYGKITFIQFVICIYLISYYTKLDARGTQNLENSSQFSFNMVIFLFIQVFVMILERYISRTNTRINLQKARGNKKLDDTELTSKMTLGDNPRSLSIHIQAQKTSDTILFGKPGKSDATDQSKKILSIELQHTRMTNQQVMKWIIQWALLILYHALVFWFFPLSSNDAIYGTPYCDTSSSQFTKYGCLSFKQNWFIIIFYLIFCYYFMLSALQIRYGYPDFKEPSSLTSVNSIGNVLLYRVFYVLPFLLELKVILDWCFQKTSLDIFQWLELAEVDSELYFFKNGNKGYFQRKLGTRIVKFEKCLCGCFCLGVILFFLVGPFFLFSNLSYIADENLVTDATIDFGIKIEDIDRQEVYEFPLFYTDSPLSMLAMSEKEYQEKQYQLMPETKFFEPSQVQLIKMKNSSDTEWAVSGDYRNTFRGLIDDTLHGSEQIKMTLEFKYSFTRLGPVEAPVTSGSHIRVLNFDQPADKEVLQQLHQVIEMDCEQDPNGVKGFALLDFIPYQLRLGEQKEVIQLPLPRENVTLSYSCQNYWALNVNLQGLLFITFSDLISSNLFDATSILGFYAGVAVLVGQTLRTIVVYHANRMYITEIPDPDPVRNLISAIYMQRLEQNLKKEEELFFILMEILRSPDIIRVICGSSLRAPLVQPKDVSAYSTSNNRA